MSFAIDANVSNGTCYYTQNTETKGDFIPCGNVALGHWPCCHTGDFCLSFDEANACYDVDTGNTYIAGCTDPGFNDPACAWKSTLFNEQEWVAIHQCPGGTGSDDAIWGGCKAPANSTELERLPLSSCDPYCQSTLYKGGTSLTAYASLPSSASASIAWTNGFEPTAAYTAVTTTIAGTKTTITSTQAQSTTTTPTSTATQSTSTSTTVPPASTSNELSTGAKAGIGVGAAVAGLLFITAILLFLLFRRRKREAKPNQDVNVTMQNQPDLSNRQYAYPSYQPSETTQLSPEPWPQELAAAPRNDYYKPELPANQGLTPTCELPADHSMPPRENLGPQQYNSYAQSPSPNSPYSTLDSSGADHVSSYSGTTAGYDGYRYGNTPDPASAQRSSTQPASTMSECHTHDEHTHDEVPPPPTDGWKTEGVRVIPGDQLDHNTGNAHSTPGMDRAAAINFARVGAKKIWAGTVHIHPDAKTGAHHHGHLESVIYVVKGRARMRWGEKLEFTAEAGPGDFIYVPPYVPHQEINASADERLECVLMRSDSEAVAVNLPDLEPVEKPSTVKWIDPTHTH